MWLKIPAQKQSNEFFKLYVITFWQIIGRSFGRNGKLQKILHRLDDLVNTVANPGYDALYGSMPFLRHLPFPMTKNINELHRTKQQMMEHLETLLVSRFQFIDRYQFACFWKVDNEMDLVSKIILKIFIFLCNSFSKIFSWTLKKFVSCAHLKFLIVIHNSFVF